jgi:hypothetical protein
VDRRALSEYLATTPLLVELCRRNGCPDPETLRVEIVEQKPDHVLCNVRFEEVSMEAASGDADRIECWGQCLLHLDRAGRVTRAEVVAAQRD